ncbi:hypothetical protein DFJ74DRAFT_255135 [Hyaloraphidium curvatum]|nr:hypothetical protein DFJ74DRAFT_255135 [Hyaloraphidium curvatum]
MRARFLRESSSLRPVCCSAKVMKAEGTAVTPMYSTWLQNIFPSTVLACRNGMMGSCHADTPAGWTVGSPPPTNGGFRLPTGHHDAERDAPRVGASVDEGERRRGQAYGRGDYDGVDIDGVEERVRAAVPRRRLLHLAPRLDSGRGSRRHRGTGEHAGRDSRGARGEGAPLAAGEGRRSGELFRCGTTSAGSRARSGPITGGDATGGKAIRYHSSPDTVQVRRRTAPESEE